MSQEQFRKYQDPLKSWDHNMATFGIFNAGRYCGFDTMNQVVSGLTFTIGHDATGVTVRDYNSTTLGPTGKYITKQGVEISETAPIGPFTINTNSGNAYWR
jgi:hypothetical protein